MRGGVGGCRLRVLEFFECLLDVLGHGEVNMDCCIITHEVYVTEEDPP